jgi:hypothetical protein
MLRFGLLLAALLPLTAAYAPAFSVLPSSAAARQGIGRAKPAFACSPIDVRAPRLRRSPRVATMMAAPPPRDRDDLLRDSLELNAMAEQNDAIKLLSNMVISKNLS